jgi:hypothetical protein
MSFPQKFRDLQDRIQRCSTDPENSVFPFQDFCLFWNQLDLANKDTYDRTHAPREDFVPDTKAIAETVHLWAETTEPEVNPLAWLFILSSHLKLKEYVMSRPFLAATFSHPDIITDTYHFYPSPLKASCPKWSRFSD